MICQYVRQSQQLYNYRIELQIYHFTLLKYLHASYFSTLLPLSGVYKQQNISIAVGNGFIDNSHVT
jgi:hypothetical protein